jgi:hypothetical protein
MIRKKKGYVSGFSQRDYDKVVRKLSRLSVRELLSQLDQYLTSMLSTVTAYQHNNREYLLMEMKRDLITLMAVVDELDEELKARHTIY